MSIQCVNCGLEFAHDPPPPAPGETPKARCPRCGHNNEIGGLAGPAGLGDPTGAGGMGGPGPVPGDTLTAPAVQAAGPAGGTDEVFCFNCGKPMQANAQELIPVCDECKAGGTGASAPAPAEDALFSPEPVLGSTTGPGPAANPLSAAPLGSTTGAGPEVAGGFSPPSGSVPEAGEGGDANLMVRKSNGQVYGPFPRETVLDWIKTGKIMPDEEVSKIGGAWRLFSRHEEFSTLFPDAAPASPAPTQELQFKKINVAAESMRSAAKYVIGVGFVIVVIVGAYYLASQGTLALPDKVMDKAETTLHGGPNDENYEAFTGRTGELIAELLIQYPLVEGTTFEHYYRARALMDLGNPRDLEEAVVSMEMAVAADPRNAAALSGLGELYVRLAMDNEAGGELQRKSFYFIDHALETGEYRLEANRAKAWFMYTAGKPDETIKFCNTALSIHGDDPETYLLLALAEFEKTGAMTGKTLEHFQKALELDPGYSDVYFHKGVCYETVGEYTRAIDEFKAKIEADPHYIGSYFSMGNLYEQVGDYQAAIESYESVLGMDDHHRDAILRLGRLHTQFGADAKRAAILYMRLDDEGAPVLGRGERVEFLLGRSCALRHVGEPVQACTYADEAVTMDPTNAIAYFEKAMCEYGSGNRAEAIKAFALADNYMGDLSGRELATLKFFQAKASLDDERIADALDSFDRAMAAEEGFVPATLAKSAVFASLGQRDKVKSTLRSLRAVDPKYYAQQTKLLDIYSEIPSLQPICKSVSETLVGVNFDPELYGLAGAVCYHAGDTKRANSYLSRALEDDPGQWTGLLYTGLLSMDSGDFSKSNRVLSRLTEEHRDVGAFYLWYAHSLNAAGKTTEAEEAYSSALKYNQALPWAHQELGLLYINSERNQDAKQEFISARKKDQTLLAPQLQLFQHKLL